MGSRYGGLKQLDGLGPHGETIMDYSIYDAINAGFGKLVSLSVKTSKKTSARLSSQNMKATSHAKWCSRASMLFLKVSLALKAARNLGVPTTP